MAENRSKIVEALSRFGQRVATMPTVEGIKAGFMHPGEVYAGRADPMDVEKALGTVGMAGTGGLAATPLKPAGSFGMFGGGRSPMADHAAKARFEKMEAGGASSAELWGKTGWERGRDGSLRFEIPDQRSQLRSFDRSGGGVMKLSDVIDHPELFQAYPHMAEFPVVLTQGKGAGGLNGLYMKPGQSKIAEGGHIEINGQLPDDELRSLLLHEVQHPIQHHEGFASGTNPRAVGPERYVRDAGENEAGNVQTRLDWTDAQRRAVAPSESALVRPGAQVINHTRGPSAADPETIARIAHLLGPKT